MSTGCQIYRHPFVLWANFRNKFNVNGGLKLCEYWLPVPFFFASQLQKQVQWRAASYGEGLNSSICKVILTKHVGSSKRMDVLKVLQDFVPFQEIMRFSQNFYLYKCSWEISLWFLNVLVALPYGATSVTTSRWGQVNFVELHDVVKDQPLWLFRKDLSCQQLMWNFPILDSLYAYHHGGIWGNTGIFSYSSIIWRLMTEAMVWVLGLPNPPYGPCVQSFWKDLGIVVFAHKAEAFSWALIFNTGYVWLLYTYFKSWYWFKQWVNLTAVKYSSLSFTP